MNHGASVVRRSHPLLKTQTSSRSPPQVIISTTKVFLNPPTVPYLVCLFVPLTIRVKVRQLKAKLPLLLYWFSHRASLFGRMGYLVSCSSWLNREYAKPEWAI